MRAGHKRSTFGGTGNEAAEDFRGDMNGFMTGHVRKTAEFLKKYRLVELSSLKTKEVRTGCL